MMALLCILGLVVFVYGSSIFLIMFICKCSLEEARDKIASFFQNDGYRLDCDYNFKSEINKICLDILGESRYRELCKLEEYSSTFVFIESDGYPSFRITINVNDENEKKMIESIILQTTKRFLFNYSTNLEVLSEWMKNDILGLPMLVIYYSRNKAEADSIRRKKETEISNILVASTDIVDDTSEDLS